MYTDAHNKAAVKYRSRHVKRISVDFYLNSGEQPLLDWLNQQENKTSYIKNLIRKDMDSHRVSPLQEEKSRG